MQNVIPKINKNGHTDQHDQVSYKWIISAFCTFRVQIIVNNC